MTTVICGLVKASNNTYLIARRAQHKDHAGFWEFPGGKLEPEESHEQCLKRELLEELGMQVMVGLKATETIHQFEAFSIHLIAYHCSYVSASFKLTDHDRYAWVAPHELMAYKLSPSDVVFAELLNDY